MANLIHTTLPATSIATQCFKPYGFSSIVHQQQQQQETEHQSVICTCMCIGGYNFDHFHRILNDFIRCPKNIAIYGRIAFNIVFIYPHIYSMYCIYCIYGSIFTCILFNRFEYMYNIQ